MFLHQPDSLLQDQNLLRSLLCRPGLIQQSLMYCLSVRNILLIFKSIKGGIYNYQKVYFYANNNDDKGKLKLVTVYSITDAPFKIIWNSVLDLKSYKEFTPRLKEVKLSAITKKNEITADYEMDARIFNIKYRLVIKYDKQKRTIDIQRISGDCEGSHWSWKFEETRNKILEPISKLFFIR